MHAHAGALGWLLPVGLVGVGAAGYLVAETRRERRGRRPWPRRRTAAGLAGLLLAGAALSPPLAAAAAADPRGHMAQHLLLGMYAPLLLVLSAPVTLLLGASGPRAGRRIGRVLRSPVVSVVSSPWCAAALHSGGLLVLYLTPLYEASTRSALVHGLVAAHLLLAGCLYAWSIAGPDPAPRRPGTAQRAAVLVLSAAVHAVLAKVLYARAGTWPPGTDLLPAAAEQAARWMYYGGDVAEVVLAVLLLSGRRRRRRGAPLPGARTSVEA